MARRLVIAAVLASMPILAGCGMEFAQARPDATPFAAADGECWDYAGVAAPDDHLAMYETCMARHGWRSCAERGGCGPEAPSP